MRLPPQRYELGSIVRMLRKNILTPVLAALVFVFFACSYLWLTTPLYEARITVIARVQTPDLPGSDLIGGLGLSLLGNLGGASELTPYDKLIAILGSNEVAQAFMQHEELLVALFPDQWDPQSDVWRQPLGLRVALRNFVNRVFGLPPIKIAGTDPVASYLNERLQVVPNETEGSHTMVLQHADADVARRVLDTVLASADSLLRARDKQTNLENVAFLRERLTQEPMVEVREVLSRRLGEEYVTSSLLSNGASYSYEVLRQLSVSTQPVTPRPILTLFISALGGAIVGAALVLLLLIPAEPKRQ
jgi:uncharacterized protein involved in exopolysaccharide biosynthesis